MKRKAEIIKHLLSIKEGIEGIVHLLELENLVDTAIEDSHTVKPVDEKPVEVAPKTEVVETSGEYTKEQLRAMKYNEFKKYAASLGVKCTGTRDEILERILSLNSGSTSNATTSETAPETASDVSEEKSAEVIEIPAKKTKAKKTAVKEEPVEDEFDRQAKAIAKETDVEDIIEVLAESDIKATKTDYLEKLAFALRKGLIEIDDEDDEVEDTTDDVSEDEETADVEDTDEDTDEEDSEEFTPDSYFEEYDPDGINNPDDMSDARAKAVREKVEEILSDYDNLDIEDFLENSATQAEIDLLPDDYDDTDLLKLYIEIIKRTIDDDGEEHTEKEEPYEIADNEMCCGHKLKYIKKTGRYVCEICGSEYTE